MNVIVVGQTPPPYHGQAIAISKLVNADWSDVSISHIRLEYSRSAKDVGRFSCAKVLHLVSCAWRTIRALRRSSNPVLYYPPGGSVVSIIRDILFLLLVRRFADKLVLHFHACGMAATIEGRWWLRRAARMAYGNADVSIKLQDDLPPDAECLNPRKVVVVPNGLDVPVVAAPYRAEKRGVRILFAGLHTEEKGIYIVIEAAKRLRQAGVNVQVHLMGSWCSEIEECMCERLVADSNLSGCVKFLGCLTGDDKWREYAEADIFFFPSFYRAELMPLVVIEAMAYSLPVVASSWRGITGMVEHGNTGFLFPERNTDVAVECLASLAKNEALRERMGQAARRCYLEKYTLKHHLNAMHSVFFGLSNDLQS